MNKKQSKGFTLIELMITVVIVAILASLAISSYLSQVQKGRRTCATTSLQSISTLQERSFFQANQYSANVTDLYGANECKEGQHYTLAIAFSVGGEACSDTNNCYTATATAQGAQVDDDQCRTYTIDNLGVKTAKNPGGDDTTESCW